MTDGGRSHEKKSDHVLSPTPEFTLAAGLLLLSFLVVRGAH